VSVSAIILWKHGVYWLKHKVTIISFKDKKKGKNKSYDIVRYNTMRVTLFASSNTLTIEVVEIIGFSSVGLTVQVVEIRLAEKELIF
jgi:hypothetical protein